MNDSAIDPVKPTILLVNDKPRLQGEIETLLQMHDYHLAAVANLEEAIRYLHKNKEPDLVLLGPGAWGVAAIQTYRRIHPARRLVVISERNNMQAVVEAIKLGAVDCIFIPVNREQVTSVFRRYLSKARLAEPGQFSSREPVAKAERKETFEDDLIFLAESSAMKLMRNQLQLIARVDVPVLILGESGAGKEVMAKFIHKASKRAGRPLLKVNCAALPADLLESELFGYEKGAFTGAIHSKPGKFELCHEGTILLDEIGELHRSVQAKLLHVLQDGQFSRLGGRVNISTDSRVIAATNIDVRAAVREGSFREDLYYRLNAFTIYVPPLRERREEIPVLLAYFMKKHVTRLGCPPTEYSQELIQACIDHHWPGNVRELENFVKRHLVLRDEHLAIAELKKAAPAVISFPSPTGGSDLKSLVRDLKTQAELRAIQEALAVTNGNRRLAAQRLNISYKAMLYKIRQYEGAVDLEEQPKQRSTSAG